MKKATTANRLKVEAQRSHSSRVLYVGAPDTEIMTRLAILCALPPATQGDEFYFERHHGPFRLNLFRVSSHGLPYGIWPRLLFHLDL